MSHKIFLHLMLGLVATLFLWALSPARPAAAQSTCTSVTAGGNWTSSATWTGCGGTFPQNGDHVVISGGTVTVNESTNNLASLTVNSTLILGDSNTARTVTVNGPITISGGTIRPRNMGSATIHTLFIRGNLTNNGTFDAISTGNPKITTIFNGTTPQTISGSSVSAFYNLTINSGATVILPGNPALVTAAATGTVTNNGTLQQTRTVNNATVQFMTISTDRYRGVDINTVNNLGDVTVTIRGNSGLTCTDEGTSSPHYAFRCFDITPTNQAAARVTLWSTSATPNEQNGIATADLAVYRFNLGSWQLGTGRTTGTGSNSYVFAQGDVPGFSAFLMASVNAVPTAITLGQMETAQNLSWVWVGLVGLLLLLVTAGWLKKVNREQ